MLTIFEVLLDWRLIADLKNGGKKGNNCVAIMSSNEKYYFIPFRIIKFKCLYDDDMQ